jgi:hypothetical protein
MANGRDLIDFEAHPAVGSAEEAKRFPPESPLVA